jgi:hypothetical protein
MYWLDIQELYPLGLHTNIIVGQDISEKFLLAYDAYLQTKVYTPKNKNKVKDLVGDGHAKVHMTCGSDHTHQGCPRKNEKAKPYGHGWFILINPHDLRVLGVSCMKQPESNDVAEMSLEKVIPLYKQCDGFVMDRVCAFVPCASGNGKLRQIKYWAVDKFHALKHKKTCKHNILQVRRLVNRFKKTKTSACEQVFSWFRNYARRLNEARPWCHAFSSPYFAKLHNAAIDQKQAHHLNPFRPTAKPKPRSYACSKIVAGKVLKRSRKKRAGYIIM